MNSTTIRFLISYLGNKAIRHDHIIKNFIFALMFLTAFVFDFHTHQFQQAEGKTAGEPVSGTSRPQAMVTSKNAYYDDKFAILTYHHIDSVESGYTISPGRFVEQIDTLRKLGYNFISLNQATEFLEGRGKIPANALVVTFDDGYDSFYHYAYPVLKERSIPATMFVVVRYVGGSNGTARRMGWQEMWEMQGDGFAFYSHTYDSHHYIQVDANGTRSTALGGLAYVEGRGQETPGEFNIRVGEDLSRAKQLIEVNLSNKAEYLALPFGTASPQAVKVARELGYKYILTTKPGLNNVKIPATDLLRFNAGSPNKNGNSIHQEITRETTAQVKSVSAQKPENKSKPKLKSKKKI